MFTFNFIPDVDDAGDGEAAAVKKEEGNNNTIISQQPDADDDDGHNNIIITGQQQQKDDDDDDDAINGRVVLSSHPFVWKDHNNLETTLNDRAQQEIVFQEIELSQQQQQQQNQHEEEEERASSPDTSRLDDDDDQLLRRVCMDQYEKEVTPGVYEGGLQVWECSLDLVRYFHDNSETIRLLLPGHNKSALELGCGHGLPGCWLLRQALLSQQKQQQQKQQQQQQQQQEADSSSSSSSSFQMVFVDYNDYVIDDVTISNIIINTAGLIPAKTLAQRRLVRLGSGDWMDMSRQLQQQQQQQHAVKTSAGGEVEEEGTLTEGLVGSSSNSSCCCCDSDSSSSSDRFDYIIAAETTYTPDAAKDTAILCLRHLKIGGTGIGFIASKRYYFGVGGGTDAFREAAAAAAAQQQQELSSSSNNNNYYYLKVETVRVFDNGVGNIREILKVTCHVK